MGLAECLPYISESEKEINNRKFYYAFEAIESITFGFYFFKSKQLEKVGKDREYIYRFDDSEGLKIKLLSYIKRKKINTKIIVLNKDTFELSSVGIEFDLRLETNSIWYKILC